MIDLKGKVAVVFGLANKRSIAWAICQKLSEAGATLAICYQSERLQRDAEALAAELPSARTFQCDVAFDDQIDAVFAQIASTYGAIDTLVSGDPDLESRRKLGLEAAASRTWDACAAEHAAAYRLAAGTA